VEGLQLTTAYQITAMLLWSTLSEPLLKQLISVLGAPRTALLTVVREKQPDNHIEGSSSEHYS